MKAGFARTVGLFALLGALLAPGTAAASSSCLDSSLAIPLTTAVRGTHLPDGWKVISVNLGIRDVRIALVDPGGSHKSLRLGAGEGPGPFSILDPGSGSAVLPAALVESIVESASSAVGTEAWAECERPEASRESDNTGAIDETPVVPRGLALVVAHFRMLLLLACVGLVLYRSLWWRRSRG